jgi:hypothetical protein
MNERIEALAKQAAEYAIEFAVKDQELYIPKLMEKFAELIVRECAEIGDNYQDILGNEPECANCRKVAYGIVDKIKQHFGVEE